ncbi:MAG TPA: DUF3973 domain-containing protein [Bacilli bacterium]|nr:DUF3973 domain-containing protein [Bacilli bacterium]
MSMYYCIVCRDLHQIQDSMKIFTTGFHTLQGGQDFPLGFCKQVNLVVEERVKTA